MAAMTDTRVKPHVRAAAQEISNRFGITNIGGFATSGHISNSDHYKGLALDVMTSIKGQQVADFTQQNAARLRVTYIIWNRRIWDSRNGKGWQPYSGTSPHTDHVHISFHPTGDAVPGQPGTDKPDGFTNPTAPGETEAQGCMKLLMDMFTKPLNLKGKKE